MNYLALGDSISIDDYTGVQGGGAASQFARMILASRFENLTRDGNTTVGVLSAIPRVDFIPNVVTLTAGGNDFLQAASWGAESVRMVGESVLRNLAAISVGMRGWGCPVIINTIYDPTDGDDSLGAALGISPSYRPAFDALNQGIRQLAGANGFLISDLHALFLGHGIAAEDCWIVSEIEPNLAGATAIARHWHSLLHEAAPFVA